MTTWRRQLHFWSESGLKSFSARISALCGTWLVIWLIKCVWMVDRWLRLPCSRPPRSHAPGKPPLPRPPCPLRPSCERVSPSCSAKAASTRRQAVSRSGRDSRYVIQDIATETFNQLIFWVFYCSTILSKAIQWKGKGCFSLRARF